MADAKISALTALASGHATGDLIPIVDVSDTTQAASGTTKKTTIANLLANLPGPTDAVGISFTGQSLTGSNASTLLNLSGTWNTTGTPTALKVNITDTASNASSLLQDWQVGGVSVMNLRKDGRLTTGEIRPVSVYVTYAQLTSSSTGPFNLGSDAGIGWGSATNPNSVFDTIFRRHAAGVLRAGDSSTGIRGLLGGGASVASAAALPAPTGRVFHVTGTTTITSITSTNFQSGTVITMIFDASLTVTHGGNIILAGAANFSATANDTLTMAYDGTNWYEVCRSVN